MHSGTAAIDSTQNGTAEAPRAVTPLVVAMDGPGGAGKSSLARDLALRLGFFHLDSGAMYRALTWWMLQNDVRPQAPERLVALARETNLQLIPAGPGTSLRVFLQAQDVTPYLRDETISRNVAPVADLIAIREYVNEIQREFAGTRAVVADGRDIATVVFPDAPVKIYLDAKIEVRAKRRHDQLLREHESATASDKPVPSAQSVREAMEERDRRDRSRPFGSLRRDPDAILVDSSDMTYAETLDRLEQIVRDAFRERGMDLPPTRPELAAVAAQQPTAF